MASRDFELAAMHWQVNASAFEYTGGSECIQRFLSVCRTLLPRLMPCMQLKRCSVHDAPGISGWSHVTVTRS